MKIQKVDDIWNWLRTTMSKTLRYYYVGNGIYRVMDNSSILLANPILRQMRVENSELCFFLSKIYI